MHLRRFARVCCQITSGTDRKKSQRFSAEKGFYCDVSAIWDVMSEAHETTTTMKNFRFERTLTLEKEQSLVLDNYWRVTVSYNELVKKVI